MLELAQYIKDFLYANNKPPPKSFYEEMMSNKRRQEEIQAQEHQRKQEQLRKKEEKQVFTIYISSLTSDFPEITIYFLYALQKFSSR